MLDFGTSEDNFFCFVQNEDELVKNSPVSDVIKFDINTNISTLGDEQRISAYQYQHI